MKLETVSIKNTTKGKYPILPFVQIKEAILGKDYELSIVFCGNSLSRRLNRIYRAKDNPTDILSFPLSKKSGEIFIDLSKAKKNAIHHGEKYKNFIGFLFIHGLLHLKGLKHGRTMEQAEKEFRNRLNI